VARPAKDEVTTAWTAPPAAPARQRLALIGVFAAWVAAGCAIYAAQDRGSDLVPLIIAARLAWRGLDTALYARSAESLRVDDPAWLEEAAAIGYDGLLYPFMYPPLVAHALAPLAPLDFTTLRAVAAVLEVAALAAAIGLAAWQWNRDWLRPWPLFLIFLGLALSVPVYTGSAAMNVQPLVVLIAVVAMVASQRDRPALAGIALALAALVKITPAALVLYWLASKRHAAAAWFAGAFAGLMATGVAVAGVDAHLRFFESLVALTRSFVPIPWNQGLPVLLYSFGAELVGVETMRLVAVPQWISLANAVAAIGALGAVVFGARRHRDTPVADAAGMAAALLIVTMTSTVAWSHYYAFLAIPVLIWGGIVRSGSVRCALPVVAAVLVSVPFMLAGRWLAEITGARFLFASELAAAALLLAGLLGARRARSA
jgi:hypothetical protein